MKAAAACKVSPITSNLKGRTMPISSAARSHRFPGAALAVLVLLVALPAGARADRRYFASTYPPYIDQAGESTVGSGKVKIQIEQRYALKDAAQAHRDLEARKTTGSTIFTV